MLLHLPSVIFPPGVVECSLQQCSFAEHLSSSQLFFWVVVNPCAFGQVSLKI